MSDFTETLSPEEAAKREAILKNLEARSNDTYLIYNPTDEDFYIPWNGLVHGPVPSRNKDLGHGAGKSIQPKYLAMHYVKHMTDRMMNKTMDDAVLAENTTREKAGRGLMNPQEKETFETPYRLDNEEKRSAIQKTLVLGLVQRFGVAKEAMGNVQNYDRRPLEEKLFDDQAYVETDQEVRTQSVPSKSDVEKRKADVLSEVSE